MQRSNISFFVIVAAIIVMVVSCSKKPEYTCTTCPEENPSAKAARAYVDAHLADFGLREGIDVLDILDVNTAPDSYDMVSFYQSYHGVHVTQGYLWATVNLVGQVENVTYNVVTGIDIDTRYKISSLTALTTAKFHFQQIVGDAKQDGNGELAIYRLDGIDYLCWHFNLRSDLVSTLGDYYIDAHTGELVTYSLSEPVL